MTEAAFDRGDYIFFAIDAHDENDAFHPESKLFPPHNIKGTSGRNLYGPLAVSMRNIKEILGSFGWISATILLFLGRI